MRSLVTLLFAATALAATPGPDGSMTFQAYDRLELGSVRAIRADIAHPLPRYRFCPALDPDEACFDFVAVYFHH